MKHTYTYVQAVIFFMENQYLRFRSGTKKLQQT
jgi:hypothetical protein